VERATNFLAHHLPEDYLSSYRRQLAELPDIGEGPRTLLPGGAVDATLRTNEGKGSRGDLRRTTYLRLVSAGPDLWVVRVTVPTERDGIERTALFEPVAAGFEPGT
jgi:hypothetical protein